MQKCLRDIIEKWRTAALSVAVATPQLDTLLVNQVLSVVDGKDGQSLPP